MNSDFRVSVGFQHSIKIRKLRKSLGPGGPLCLIHLWGYAAQHCPDGRLGCMDADDIEEVVLWEGTPGAFVDALLLLRLIEEDGDAYKIHEWAIHNGYASVASIRSEKARKAARVKWSARGNAQADASADAQADASADAQADASADAPSPSPSPSPSPLPSDASTSIESSADRNELAAALGKIMVSDAEVLTWQQLKKLKCTIADVESARKKVGKNSLNYLKNSVCEARDKRTAAEEPQGVDLEEYFGKGTKLQ